MQFGTARKPPARKSLAVQPSNFDGTLSHHFDFPGPPPVNSMSFRRNERSTAFLSHWLVTHCVSLAPSTFSATRASPESSMSSAVATALRIGPLVFRVILSRASQACSMMA